MPGRRRRWAVVVAVPALVAAVSTCSREPERTTAAFCERVVAVRSLDQILASGDVAQVRAQVGLLQALQQVSPPDIEPHVARLAGITDELGHALGSVNDPDAAADEVFRRHQGDLGDITAAGAAVERYAATNCDVILNPTGSSPVASTPGTSGAPGPTVDGSAPR